MHAYFLQESRRVLIAEWQHIIYNEYLPTVLGAANMRRHDLDLVRNGYATGTAAAVHLQLLCSP